MDMHRNIVERLTAEHGNMVHVLALVRVQLEMLRPDSPAASFTLLESAIGYLSGFHGRFHHPMEDLIFQCLVRCAPDKASACARLIEEHIQINVQESRMLRHLVQARSGDSKACQAVRILGCTYCDIQAQHIDVEECETLPAAMCLLQATDWSRIRNAASASSDPLSDPDMLRRHETVYDYLMEAGADLRRH